MKAFKFLTLSLAVAALCLGYASCGDDDDDENSPAEETTVSGGGSGTASEDTTDEGSGISDEGNTDEEAGTTDDETADEGNTYEESITGSINGHDYVDLGLSVKWATCNVGADTLYDCGDYFAWGETVTKSTYTSSNSVTYGKYMGMGDISGNATYDAARANWGGSWRMPTKDEVYELINNCTTEWTTLSGVNGYKVTGPNGNSIFLPAAGWRNGTSLDDTGEYGLYWSSTPHESNTSSAYNLYFNVGDFVRDWDNRDYGQSVRPVSE